jgi:membrane-bound metal-dependent hydrolase YbcI (DUF457 family)
LIAGHLGIAGAVYAARRGSSLPWLLVASMAPDGVDALYVLAGICNPHGLYSHTIPAAALIAALTGAVVYFATDRRATGALAALLVLAHLPADYVTGHKLFWPGGELLGWQLYERPALDFALESTMAVGGWWLVRATGRAPRWATRSAALVAVLLLQGALDTAGARRGGVKPTACGRAEPLAMR